MTDYERENFWISREVERDALHQRAVDEVKRELEKQRNRAERLQAVLGFLLFACSFVILLKVGGLLVRTSRDWVRVLGEWGLLGYVAVGIPFMQEVAKKIGGR